MWVNSITLLLLILSSISFAQSLFEKKEEDFQNAMSCSASNQLNEHCLSQSIISDIENISDLIKIVEELDQSELESQRRYIIQMWELKQKPSQDQFASLEYLSFQYEIFKALSDCLYEREIYMGDEKGPYFENIPDYDHFFFGNNKKSFSRLLGRNYYQCTIEKKAENLNESEFDKFCKEEAWEKYFSSDLVAQLTFVKKEYGENLKIDKSLIQFQRCKNLEKKDPLICLKTLNSEINTLKMASLIESIKKDYKLSSEQVKSNLDNYKNCLRFDTSAAKEYEKKPIACKGFIFTSLESQLLKSIPEKDQFSFSQEVLKQCEYHSGIMGEKSCLSALKLAKSAPKHLETELFYHNQKIIDDAWKRSDTHYLYQDEVLVKQLDDKSQEFLKKVPDLTLKEIQCLYNYTGSHYTSMNKILWSAATRTNNADENMGLIGCAKSALAKINKAHKKDDSLYKEVLYRGVNEAPFTERFKNKNDCIVFTGFTSTTHDLEMRFDGIYKLKIKNCPQDSDEAGSLVDPISANSGEMEVLFPPGARFRVTKSVDDDPYMKHVELECITKEQMKKEKLECY